MNNKKIDDLSLTLVWSKNTYTEENLYREQTLPFECNICDPNLYSLRSFTRTNLFSQKWVSTKTK